MYSILVVLSIDGCCTVRLKVCLSECRAVKRDLITIGSQKIDIETNAHIRCGLTDLELIVHGNTSSDSEQPLCFCCLVPHHFVTPTEIVHFWVLSLMCD